MYPLRAFRRLFSWIAFLAILGGALAPAVSHLLHKQQGGKTMLEVCTAKGVRLVAVDADNAKQGKPLDPVAMEHCPFCVPHAGAQGLIPAGELVFNLPEAAPRFYPPLYYAAARPLFAWAASQPRAPPVLSA